jgi:hypothetical protein
MDQKPFPGDSVIPVKKTPPRQGPVTQAFSPFFKKICFQDSLLPGSLAGGDQRRKKRP